MHKATTYHRSLCKLDVADWSFCTLLFFLSGPLLGVFRLQSPVPPSMHLNHCRYWFNACLLLYASNESDHSVWYKGPPALDEASHSFATDYSYLSSHSNAPPERSCFLVFFLHAKRDPLSGLLYAIHQIDILCAVVEWCHVPLLCSWL